MISGLTQPKDLTNIPSYGKELLSKVNIDFEGIRHARWIVYAKKDSQVTAVQLAASHYKNAYVLILDITDANILSSFMVGNNITGDTIARILTDSLSKNALQLASVNGAEIHLVV